MNTKTNVFETLPDHSDLWIYAADRPLDAKQQQQLRTQLPEFLNAWRSHGRIVAGCADVYFDRFLVIAAFMPEGDISGCGIDASVHQIEALAAELGINWLTALDIHYLEDGGTVRTVSRPEFRKLLREEIVNADTRVIDTSIRTLKDVRDGAFVRPAGESWHKRVFRISDRSVTSAD